MANNTTFGGPTFHSEVEFNIGISEDNKALTATFGGLGTLGLGAASDRGLRQSSHAYFLLPSRAVRRRPGMEIPFFVSGFVASEEGADGHLLFSVNDQNTVVYFPKNSDNDFVQQFNYKSAWSSSFHYVLSPSGAGL